MMQQATSAILLSGGLDSIAVACWKRPEIAITIDYGQPAQRAEYEASSAVCEKLNIYHIKHKVEGIFKSTIHHHQNSSDKWIPFRNQMLITVGAMICYNSGAKNLLIGTVESDGHRYQDGSIDFLTTMGQLLQIQEGKIVLSAPALHLSTIDLVRSSGIPVELAYYAHSCNYSSAPCGKCASCVKLHESLKFFK